MYQIHLTSPVSENTVAERERDSKSERLGDFFEVSQLMAEKNAASLHIPSEKPHAYIQRLVYVLRGKLCSGLLLNPFHNADIWVPRKM